MGSLFHGRLLLSSPWESDLNKSLIVGFASGAFSAALACLFLFSIYQCILRLVTRRELQQQEQQQEHSLELDPRRFAELSHIPIMIYDSSSSSIQKSGGGGGGCNVREGETSCVVCLTDYEGGEEVRIMPRCKHTFHRECIDRWLAKRSSLCPVCRDRVIEKSVEATGCGDSTVASLDNVGLSPRQHLV